MTVIEVREILRYGWQVVGCGRGQLGRTKIFGRLLARLDEKRLMMARQHPSAPASVHESFDLSANFDDTVDGNRCVSVNLGAMSSKNSTQVLPCCRGWKGSWRVVRPHRAFANPLFTVSRLIGFSRLYGVRVGQASVAFPITFGRR
jgi:hypothetical protein